MAKGCSASSDGDSKLESVETGELLVEQNGEQKERKILEREGRKECIIHHVSYDTLSVSLPSNMVWRGFFIVLADVRLRCAHEFGAMYGFVLGIELMMLRILRLYKFLYRNCIFIFF